MSHTYIFRARPIEHAWQVPGFSWFKNIDLKIFKNFRI